MSQEPRWLSAQEQQAWRAFAGVLERLPAALDAQLTRDAGLIQFSYWVLAMLSETPDHSLRMSELAARSSSSQSRLSHLVARLEARGLLTRRRAEDDGRGAVANLTEAGYRLVCEQAPGHVEAVRTFVFDVLAPEQVEQLATISRVLLARVTSGGPVAD